MAARASARRTSVPLNTAQSMRKLPAACAASKVPPQPISISSQWAPRHRMRRGLPSARVKLRSSMDPLSHGSGGLVSRVAPPGHPRALTARLHAIEADLVLEGIHALPETRPTQRGQLTGLDQSRKGFFD